MKEYYNKEGLKVEKFIMVKGRPVPIYEEQYDMTPEQKILRDRIRKVQDRADISFKSSHDFRTAQDIDSLLKETNKLSEGKFKDRMQGWLKQIKSELDEREE